jgi:hypothetical protein
MSMTVNYALVYSDARTVTGQADTFAEAADAVRKYARDSFHLCGATTVYARVSNGRGAEVGVVLTDGKFPTEWQRVHTLDEQINRTRAALTAEWTRDFQGRQ